jgi:hypothetical protein
MQVGSRLLQVSVAERIAKDPQSLRLLHERLLQTRMIVQHDSQAYIDSCAWLERISQDAARRMTPQAPF